MQNGWTAVVDDDEGENWDANRPADIMLPSPARVDKVPKRWNIAEDTWKGGDSAKKAAPAARRDSGKSAHAADMQPLIEGVNAAALNEKGRLQRKRKNPVC